MTEPLVRPKRKNPVERTRLPTLPPLARSRVALGLTAAAARGAFELQHCVDCSAVQYPPREACETCLSDRLAWRPVDGGCELLSDVTLAHSQELYFRERAPWRTGLVRLDCGPNAVVLLHGDCPRPPARLRVTNRLDKAGRAVLFALPEEDTPNMADDPAFRETSCDPRLRKVLVTDAKSAVGRAVAEALLGAGAELVWAGFAEPWKGSTHLEALKARPDVTLVPLDVTDERSVGKLAGEIGGKVDILVNTAEHHRAQSITSRAGVEVARAEMDVNYFGLLRLAQAFGPAMRARGADGTASAVAWVNLLSVYALSPVPAQSTFCASKAAAFSLSQALRAEMLLAGIRVVNVFPGPIDDEWNQLVLPPKLAPAALGRALVEALRRGTEDVYPGDIAQDWLARFLDSPKALEREAATP